METKNNNKSLSARIKRRNKQGFRGIGNHSLCPKEVNISINNELINHKFEDKLANSYQKSLIYYTKKYAKIRGYSKHSGSKTLKQLERYI